MTVVVSARTVCSLRWVATDFCLAGALLHGAGLDDAVKVEAAVLVYRRHEACAGIRGPWRVEARRCWRRKPHARHAHRNGDRIRGRWGAFGQCRCHGVW